MKMKLTPADRARLITEIQARSDLHAKQDLQWVTDLERVATDLAESAESKPDTQGIFWIRLYGVIVEIRSRYKTFERIHQDAKATNRPSPLLLNIAVEIFAKLEALRTALSREEAIVADYLRQTQCHVRQTGFELGLTRSKKNLKEDYDCKILLETIAVGELQSCYDTVIHRNGLSESTFTKAMASRLLQEMSSLMFLFQSVQ